IHPGRDSATGIGLILQALAGYNGPISALNRKTPDYHMVKTKFEVENHDPAGLAAGMRAEFADATDLVTDDGVKAVFADAWVHARPSGTEPVVRIFAEAPDEAKARKLVERARKA